MFEGVWSTLKHHDLQHFAGHASIMDSESFRMISYQIKYDKIIWYHLVSPVCLFFDGFSDRLSSEDPMFGDLQRNNLHFSVSEASTEMAPSKM